MNTQETAIDIALTVAYVGFGGNAGHSKYFYSFAPEVVTVGKGQSPVLLSYSLDPEVPEYFKIVDVLTSDSKDQIGPVKIPDGGRSAMMVNKNTVKTLIFFTVLVRDTRPEYNTLISCDPQVGNDPEISPQLLA